MATKNLGTLSVYLNGNKSGLDRTLKSASKDIGDFKSFATKSISNFGSMAIKSAGAIGIALSFTDAIQGVVKLKDEMDKIGKASTNLGVSTGVFQEFEYAAQRTGTSVEMIESGFIRIKKLAGDAVSGNKEAQGIFQKLGLDPETIRDMNPEEAFNSVNSALNSLDDKMRSSVGAKIYGEQFEKMNNFLRDYVSLGKEARRRGLIINDEEIKSAEALNDALLNLGRSIRSLVTNSGLSTWLANVAQGIDQFFKEAQEYTLTTRLGTDPDYERAINQATRKIKITSQRAEKEAKYVAYSTSRALEYAENSSNPTEALGVLQKTRNNIAGWQKVITDYRREYDETRKNMGLELDTSKFKEAETVVAKMLSSLDVAIQKTKQDEKKALEKENERLLMENRRAEALDKDMLKMERNIRYRQLEIVEGSEKTKMKKYIDEQNDRYMAMYGRRLTDEEENLFIKGEKWLKALEEENKRRQTEAKRAEALDKDMLKMGRNIRYRYLEIAGDGEKAEMEKYINELNDRYMSQYGRGLTDEEKDSLMDQKKLLMDLDRSSESLQTLFNGNALAETMQKGSLEVYRLQAKMKDPAREEQLKLARENADAAKRAAAAVEIMAQKTVGIQAANIGSVIGA